MTQRVGSHVEAGHVTDQSAWGWSSDLMPQVTRTVQMLIGTTTQLYPAFDLDARSWARATTGAMDYTLRARLELEWPQIPGPIYLPGMPIMARVRYDAGTGPHGISGWQDIRAVGSVWHLPVARLRGQVEVRMTGVFIPIPLTVPPVSARITLDVGMGRPSQFSAADKYYGKDELG